MSLTDDLDKPDWLKATVLEDMLVDMKGYSNQGSKDNDSQAHIVPGFVTPAIDEQSNDDTQSRLQQVPRPPPSLGEFGGNGENEKPPQIAIGIYGSYSNPKVQLNGTENGESLESLISKEDGEGWLGITLQVCIPLFFAGLGMVFAGYILDIVKDWEVFRRVPELLVMVTPLLGLKGNLEMTLASRLSTHSNLGNLDTLKKQWYLCSGNLILIQVQANVVGFLTSLMAIGLGFVLNGAFVLDNALLLCASSMLTASIASWGLGTLMTLVVISANKFRCNPDNIAIPIAGSFGDVTTLGLLAYVASMLYSVMFSVTWLAPCVVLGCSLILPVWICIANNNEYTRDILRSGWLPVIVAMIISCFSGVVLDLAEGLYPRMALFQPVINGVGGNLVSIQASRISTSLHKYCEIGKLPRYQEKADGSTAGVWLSPWEVFTKQGIHSLSSKILLTIVIPGQAIFFMMSCTLSGHNDVSQLPLELFLSYIVAAFLQVLILLSIAQLLINWFWINKIDPDTSAIPYLTAIGDLLGTGLLFFAFYILHGQLDN